MKEIFHKIDKKLVFGIVSSVLVVACISLVSVLTHSSKKMTPVTPVKQLKIEEAVSFTQNLYDTYLKEWDSGDKAFISSHKSWFNDRFIKNFEEANSSPPNKTWLFCDKVAHKPDSFLVTGGGSKIQRNGALVYVSGTYAGHLEVSNLPVFLVHASNKWQFLAVSCESI